MKPVVFAGSLVAGYGLSSCNQTATHPNIVFILIDDLGWKDVAYMGSEYYKTPNIDRLARGGMIFFHSGISNDLPE